MKKIFISADIEGVCGIADWAETDLANPQSAWFRTQMTKEVAALCEAANESGVEEIFVKDAHGSGRNIVPDMLPRNVKLMRSWTRDPFSMMAGLDPSFEAALFVGYHSAVATAGNPLAHTMNTENVELSVNGQVASEFLLNAYTAAYFGVPSVFVSGDRLLCESAGELVPGIATVAVSEGRGNASISINPILALELIKAKALAALSGGPASPLELPSAFKIKTRYRNHYLAYRASFYPGAKLENPVEVSFKSRDWKDVITFLSFTL